MVGEEFVLWFVEGFEGPPHHYEYSNSQIANNPNRESLLDPSLVCRLVCIPQLTIRIEREDILEIYDKKRVIEREIIEESFWIVWFV